MTPRVSRCLRDVHRDASAPTGRLSAPQIVLVNVVVAVLLEKMVEEEPPAEEAGDALMDDLLEELGEGSAAASVSASMKSPKEGSGAAGKPRGKGGMLTDEASLLRIDLRAMREAMAEHQSAMATEMASMREDMRSCLALKQELAATLEALKQVAPLRAGGAGIASAATLEGGSYSEYDRALRRDSSAELNA